MNVHGIKDTCLGYNGGLLLMTYESHYVKDKVNVMAKCVILFSSHSTVSKRNV